MRLTTRSTFAGAIACFLAVGTGSAAIAGDNSENPKPFLIALDPSDGSERWRDNADETGVRRVVGETKGLVFAYETECLRGGGGRGSLVAFDRDNGRKRWRTPAQLHPATPLQFIVTGETFVVERPDGNLQGLDPATGRRDALSIIIVSGKAAVL